ncbi:hypothetical protein D3C71_850250 [compost metagenome]
MEGYSDLPQTLHDTQIVQSFGCELEKALAIESRMDRGDLAGEMAQPVTVEDFLQERGGFHFRLGHHYIHMFTICFRIPLR